MVWCVVSQSTPVRAQTPAIDRGQRHGVVGTLKSGWWKLESWEASSAQPAGVRVSTGQAAATGASTPAAVTVDGHDQGLRHGTRSPEQSRAEQSRGRAEAAAEQHLLLAGFHGPMSSTPGASPGACVAAPREHSRHCAHRRLVRSKARRRRKAFVVGGG